MTRLCALACAALLSLAAAAPAPARTVVFGYLPEWRYAGANFDTMAQALTHLALFSAEPAADGSLAGLDRLPSGEALAAARAAAARHGCALVVCFGGNGRSAHFSAVVRSAAKRKAFVANVAALVKNLSLSGVDYNWECEVARPRTRADARRPRPRRDVRLSRDAPPARARPIPPAPRSPAPRSPAPRPPDPGYAFGRGYGAETETAADYRGLRLLVRATRAALGPAAALTLAYYPDGKQEAALARGFEAADLFHAMTYDAPGAAHAPVELAERAIAGARAAGLPLGKVTLGLPFYGRSAATGDWTTWEDLVQRHAPLAPGADAVVDAAGAAVSFNGPATLAAKVRLARREGLAGVMVWEVGQDCRLAPVARGGATHGVTCPAGRASSLLAAVADAAAEGAAGGAGEL